MSNSMLIDPFGRTIDYLRISVTDRCDFRCTYCMDEDANFLPRRDILSLEEIVQVATSFVELGTRKIRITGGEPLVRKDILWALEQIAALPGLDELTITTNGSQLEKMGQQLFDAGVSRINISLDTLKRERFEELTRRDKLEQVLRGIETVSALPFKQLKLNAVILGGHNDDEIEDLVEYALAHKMDISFIEEMPLGQISHHDRAKVYISSDELRERLSQRWQLSASERSTGGPSRYFNIAGETQQIGFISPHSHNFCSTCNRVRLTAEGRLLMCLGNEHSKDLKAVMRAHPENVELLKQTIIDSLVLKPEKHHFNLEEEPQILRFMSATGG
ncbi:Cyclic pyranopterin monophosphate synthase [Marinomonas aquimarina]|uniref:GTP 3',8-cyclase n=1 Tax=Marinomonas aquimarina TaxID=295068 RepID=A0A1A8SYQ4_9GAMM|nr:GTP 3',8-cyclase MoaA [Marinomonas aquimarina]SBS24545.1 Cyclic pyranopterin monophosphate synthase [Marinomonas aquimarina]